MKKIQSKDVYCCCCLTFLISLIFYFLFSLLNVFFFILLYQTLIYRWFVSVWWFSFSFLKRALSGLWKSHIGNFEFQLRFWTGKLLLWKFLAFFTERTHHETFLNFLSRFCWWISCECWCAELLNEELRNCFVLTVSYW